MKRRNYKGRELLPLAVSDAAQIGDADAVEKSRLENKLIRAILGMN